MPAQRYLLRLFAMSFVAACVTGLLIASGAAAPGGDPPKPASVASAADLAAVAEDLVKSLDATVSNATSYKQGAEEVEHKGYVIALVANAVAEAEGEVKWKPSALAVRDAALALAKAKSQPAAAKSLKDVKDLMDAPATSDSKPMKYLDVAPLLHVMKEVNERNRPMRKNLRNPQFNRSKDTIARDAQVLALLGAIARADTESAEKAKKPQADYEKHADDLVRTAKSLAEAAKKGDQKAADDAFKAVQKACTECHAVYRPGID